MARSQRRAAPAPRRAAPAQQSGSRVPTQAPAAQPPAPVAQQAPQQPSLFANMASTAAGVAVGSAVGHTIGAGISGLFGGGGSNHSQPQQVSAPEPAPQAQTSAFAGACEPDQRAFNRCLETNTNDITACQFYFDMLKQCKASASATY